eukprot:CAMPEP_0176499542 /NCGR_PEP_ID=MMETSP0200_2-20121128/12986_1 /TAXON_ID=947934 /ORGANISM="Chaetoceros sp., Strain GSL56" /LENGTH=439 /DNA_ID=CAMNT_0017897975 /DNA_START=451 /DNA_END=1770 /DNA_ORIENTATION=+
MSSSSLPFSTSNESSNTTTTVSTRTSSSSSSSSSENHEKNNNNNHLPPKHINKNNTNTNKLLLLETSTTHSMSSSDSSSRSSSTVDVCNDGNDYEDEEQDDLLLLPLLQLSLTSATTSSASTASTPCTDLGQEHEQACPSLVMESISNVSSINSDEDCSIIDSPPLILAADADADAASPRSARTYKRQPPTKKCVHFSEKEPEIITGSSSIKPSSCMTQEERAELYWQLQDYEYFRGTARIIASEILKLSSSSAQQKQQQQQSGSHSYDAVLTRAHQYCCSQQQQPWQQNDKEELENDKDGDIFLLVPPNLFEALTHWIRAGHSRRGLEKFCIPHHMQIRPLERKAGVDAVLIAQELLQKARNNNSNDTAATATAASNQHHGKMFHFGKWHFSLDDMSNEEILRILSERFSASSRKFATVMGHADAAAVGNYQYSLASK